MVAGLTSGRDAGSRILVGATALLGAIFIAAASYAMLQQAIAPRGGSVGAPKGSPDLTVAALKRLSPGELADERTSAARAFARDPLDAAAVIDLSRIAEAEGNVDASERLTLSAGDMTPRATNIQGEAMAIFLKRRDFDRVMSRLDGLVRARPEKAAEFYALASEISGDPEGEMALARMIASNPPWRSQFFTYLLSKGQPEVASQILGTLRDTASSVEDTEIGGIINYYLQIGDVDRAYAAWLSSLGDDELRDVKGVYDGGFSHPVRSLHFDWTVRPSQGLTYRLFPRNTASMDQTLQIDFQDYAGNFSNLSQILRLRPGRFTFSGEVRFEDFASPTSLVFRLYCLDGKTLKALDETSPLPQSTQWISFEKTIDVPSKGCQNQLLQLESKSRLENEQITYGLVAIDALAIDKLPDLAQ